MHCQLSVLAFCISWLFKNEVCQDRQLRVTFGYPYILPAAPRIILIQEKNRGYYCPQLQMRTIQTEHYTFLELHFVCHCPILVQSTCTFSLLKVENRQQVCHLHQRQ
ncbi:hypothetical protein Pan54_22420 [Rubinisphaera italica]|uniref:Uncharacterized protein n=1 Tax=Rubinisphaera italica TaxID=2527969 RepID=A0A5C5XEG8_9PLAN|nr:hypothetical protein Pan54_22420 [Rubinisphaera italica]